MTEQSSSPSTDAIAPTAGDITISSAAGQPFRPGDSLTFAVDTAGTEPITVDWTISGPEGTAIGSGPTFTTSVGAAATGDETWTAAARVRNVVGRATRTAQFVVHYLAATTLTDVGLEPTEAKPGAAIRIGPGITGGDVSCRWSLGGRTADCAQSIAAPARSGTYPAAVTVVPVRGLNLRLSENLTVGDVPPAPSLACTVTSGTDDVVCAAGGESEGTTFAWNVSPRPIAVNSDPNGAQYTFAGAYGSITVSVVATTGFGSSPAAGATVSVPDVTPPTGTVTISRITNGYSVTITGRDPQSLVAQGAFYAVFRMRCSATGTESSVGQNDVLNDDFGFTSRVDARAVISQNDGTGSGCGGAYTVVGVDSVSGSWSNGAHLSWNYP